MRIFGNPPARYEGDHCTLGQLVREEARRQLERNPPDARTSDHLIECENSLYDWMKRGFMRITEDWRVVFWHPYACEFRPYDDDMHDAWCKVKTRVESGADRMYTGGTVIPDSGGAYVG